MSTIYTVTQINNQCKSILNQNFSNIWLKGEISRPNLYASGHMYFVLKDAKSELSCVFFNYTKNQSLVDGLELVLKGDLTIYPNKGKYQFVVKDFHTSGAGVLFQKYNLLKDKLTKEGLFSNSYKKEIPEIVHNIGIVTSLKGAVINDILNILNRRAPYLNLYVCDTPVQGIDISGKIINSLSSLEKIVNIDVVIIARGGGSFEDLMPFNDERLIRKIFSMEVPVISAVGHESDFTLCDFVSDYRASTPSEAAEICAQDLKEIYYNIDLLYSEIFKQIIFKLNNKKKNLDYLLAKLPSDPISLLDSKIEKIDLLYSFISKMLIKKVNFLSTNLLSKINFLNLSNPNSIKKKGYSIVMHKGEVLKNIKNINLNDNIDISLYKGDIKAKILTKKG